MPQKRERENPRVKKLLCTVPKLYVFIYFVSPDKKIYCFLL